MLIRNASDNHVGDPGGAYCNVVSASNGYGPVQIRMGNIVGTSGTNGNTVPTNCNGTRTLMMIMPRTPLDPNGPKVSGVTLGRSNGVPDVIVSFVGRSTPRRP